MTIFVTPESLSAAAANVRDEYGGDGYMLRIARPLTAPVNGVLSPYGGAVYEVRSSDGSYFEIASDRYGNTYRACDATGCSALGDFRGMEYLCDEHRVHAPDRPALVVVQDVVVAETRRVEL